MVRKKQGSAPKLFKMSFLFRHHGLRSTRPFSFPLFQRSCIRPNIWLEIRQQSGRTRLPSPPSSLRKSVGNKLDQIPQDYVFWGIIGLNGAVFLMWQLAKSKMVTFNCFHRYNSLTWFLTPAKRAGCWTLSSHAWKLYLLLAQL